MCNLLNAYNVYTMLKSLYPNCYHSGNNTTIKGSVYTYGNVLRSQFGANGSHAAEVVEEAPSKDTSAAAIRVSELRAFVT